MLTNHNIIYITVPLKLTNHNIIYITVPLMLTNHNIIYITVPLMLTTTFIILEKEKFSLDQKKVLNVALNLYGEELITDCLTKNVKIELRY